MRFTRILIYAAAVCSMSGCYYEVHDMRSGQTYYSDQWVAADGYRGPLTFEDSKGVKRRIEAADVQRIGKRDYLEATTASEKATQQPAPNAPQP